MRYSVVGFLEESFGLAVAARNTVRALEASGRPVDRVPVQHDVRTARKAEGPPAWSGPDTATVFHLNPDDVEKYSPQWRARVDPGAHTVCVPFWELPLVPRHWEPLLGAVGGVLAPTRFIGEACARVMPAERVFLHPQAVFLPEVRPDREAWGLPRDATVFMLSFDIGSDIERKNPWAGIDAFRLAFPADPDVALVIKTKPYAEVPAYQAQARELAARIQGDPRIRFIERSLRYEEVLALYASTDVMLSLHRSEGLGLHLMEAMSLGRPVVATGWSGNVDFMTAESCVAVRSGLVPLRSAHLGYQSEMGREGQVWADPDVADAARALRGLHEARARRLAMGAAAAREMEARRREMLAGAAFDALEQDLARRPPDPRAFARALRQTWLHAESTKWRRRARRVAGLLRGAAR